MFRLMPGVGPHRVIVTLSLLLSGVAVRARSETIESPSFRMVPAYPELRFERPVFLTYAEDDSGRCFVVEQEGRIRVFPDHPSVKDTRVFLDLRSKVQSYKRNNNEEGLLALAFHPDYRRNGRFFVYYTAGRPRRGVLSRFRVSHDDPNRAAPESERVILEVGQPFGNHNGCCVLFGPDGYLYVSLGDGGSANDPHKNGQNLATLLGAILRLDVDHEQDGRPYAIPPDNPFVGRAGARGEIWAYGLRNVWRMTFDRATGDLWAGDVGQNLWEEIDLITRGGNYGWNLREAMHPFREGEADGPMIDPVVEYGRKEGMSVTGGYVYRGSRLKRLYGLYVYADYVSGNVWAFRYNSGAVVDHKMILRQPKNIASFSEGPNGELFLLAFDGRIYRLEHM